VRAIRSAHAGQSRSPPTTATRVVEELAARRPPAATDLLTPRELDVLRLIAAGPLEQAASRSSSVWRRRPSRRTSGHVLGKLGLTDRTQAALYAVREGLDAGS
jgi:DNA-binding NarL/FixJ family response regulator